MSKFSFDRVFELDERGRARETPPKPQFSEEELTAARAEGQRAGYDAGLAQARQEIENAAAIALQGIAAQMPAIATLQERTLLQIKEDAARMAYVVAAKLAPALIADRPEQEVLALFADTLGNMTLEPRLVIRLPEPLVDHLLGPLEQAAAMQGFEGKLVVLGEPGLQGADCRIEWADGGAERNLTALMSQVESAVERYCAGVQDLANRVTVEDEGDNDPNAGGGSPDFGGGAMNAAPEEWTMPEFQEADGGVETPLPRVSGVAAGHMPDGKE